MSNTQGLNVADGHGMQLVCAVTGWLGGLPLSMMEDVQVGRPFVYTSKAQAAGNVGAMDCASGSGECGIGADCAGGSGCCGMGGDCWGQ